MEIGKQRTLAAGHNGAVLIWCLAVAERFLSVSEQVFSGKLNSVAYWGCVSYTYFYFFELITNILYILLLLIINMRKCFFLN